MEKEFYISLIIRKLSGEISKEEQDQLTDWLKGSSPNQSLYDQIEADWALSASAKKTIEVDVDQDFLKLKNRIKAAKVDAEQKHNDADTGKVIPLRRSSKRWLYIAASLVLLATAWFVFSPDQKNPQLALSTSVGETRTVQLSDGTKIWLNENSKLEYPETFADDARVVKFSGEGYFEVAKSSTVKFKVLLKTSTVEVLGTQFNIAENADKTEVAVHVDEGKVQFSERIGSEKIILEANQAAKYAASTHHITKLASYSKNNTSWKSNSLIFQSTKLSTVLADIEAHFGKSASLELEPLKDCIFSGYYPNPDANKVLSDIAASFGDMTLTQDRNGNYVLKGGSCKTQEE